MAAAAVRYEEEMRLHREREMRRKEEQEQARLKKMLEAEAEKRKKQAAAETGNLETKPKQRRPSRFEVTTEGGATFVPEKEGIAEESEASDKDSSMASIEKKFGVVGMDPSSPAMRALKQLSEKPKKSILKKSNSYTIHAFGIPGAGGGGGSGGGSSGDEGRRKAGTLPFNMRGGGEPSKESTSPYQTVTGAEAAKAG